MIFLQQYATPYFGLLSITSYLQHNGVSCHVVIDCLENDCIAKIYSFKPKIIGISVITTEHNWLKSKVQQLKKVLPDVIIIVGGMHAILYPEDVLSISGVDLISISDGEDVCYNLINAIAKGSDYLQIPGIAYRDKNSLTIKKNPIVIYQYEKELVETRDIYTSAYPELNKDAVPRFMSGRGCPYRCSFCYNKKIHKIYGGSGYYVRRKSPNNFVIEILENLTPYTKGICFYDDLFTLDKEWLEEFLILYRKKIKLPFMCTVRADNINEKMVQALADSNCRTAGFGLESGSYRIRKEILKKDIKDEDIISCGQLLAKYNIHVQTGNMFCLPSESFADAFSTIELNIKANVDCAFTSLYMPFPDTEIANYCIDMNYLPRSFAVTDIPKSFMQTSILNISDKKRIRNIYYLAYFTIKYPFFLPIVKHLAGIAFFSPIYKIIFIFGNLIRHTVEREISFWETLKYIWRLRRSF